MSLMIRRASGDEFYKSFRDMQSEIDRLFNGFLTERQLGFEKNCNLPKTDVFETEEGFSFEFEMPGFKKEEIKMEVVENVLSVEAERKTEEEKKEKNYHVVERKCGKYKRQFSLPENVKIEDIQAKYEDGILEVNIPKKELEAPKSKKIEIK